MQNRRFLFKCARWSYMYSSLEQFPVHAPARHEASRCMLFPGAACRRLPAGATARYTASACAALPCARGGWLPLLRLLACSQALQGSFENK